VWAPSPATIPWLYGVAGAALKNLHASREASTPLLVGPANYSGNRMMWSGNPSARWRRQAT
jgi:hypothetical protein